MDLDPRPRRRTSAWLALALAATGATACAGTDVTPRAAAATSTTTATVPVMAHPTTEDHWHMAMGFVRCDVVAPSPIDIGPDTTGIHAHPEEQGSTIGDGLIHVHPFLEQVTGPNARLGVFLDSIGATTTGDVLRLHDGFELPLTGECHGEPAHLVLASWKKADQTFADVTPIAHLADVRDVPLQHNLGVLALELVADYDPITLPPSASAVEAPPDVAAATSAPPAHDHTSASTP